MSVGFYFFEQLNLQLFTDINKAISLFIKEIAYFLFHDGTDMLYTKEADI